MVLYLNLFGCYISKHYTHVGLQLISVSMMTSSNGNTFHVTGPLCGEFTGDRWIPLTKANDAELWCFRCYAGDSGCHRAHYGVIIKDYAIATHAITSETFVLYLCYRYIRSYNWYRQETADGFIKSILQILYGWFRSFVTWKTIFLTSKSVCRKENLNEQYERHNPTS